MSGFDAEKEASDVFQKCSNDLSMCPECVASALQRAYAAGIEAALSDQAKALNDPKFRKVFIRHIQNWPNETDRQQAIRDLLSRALLPKPEKAAGT